MSEKGTAGRRVVVAGAGIAGLAAAHVLVDAGFEVVVLEKAASVGGRCASYVDPDLGHTVEHGIHGVFPRYENLTRLWRDVGIDLEKILTRTKTTGVPGPGRTMRSTELAHARGPAPLFLTAMIPPGVLRARDYAFSLFLLMRTYAARKPIGGELDTETFASMMRAAGVSGRMANLLLVPYVKNLTYARGDEVSARLAAEALNYYVLEDAEDVKAQWIDGGMVPLLFEPWKAALEKRGVRFKLGAPVQSIVFDGDRVVALATQATISDRELGDAPKLFMRKLGTRSLGLSWEPSDRRLRAFDAACTHMGCPVDVRTSDGKNVFHCPCHGGQFDANGEVLRAPPQKPLTPVRMRHEAQGSVWVVDEPTNAPAADDGLERADYAVLAMDLGSLKAVFPREMSLNSSTSGIPLLRTTSVMVLRMHFAARSGKPKWSGPDSGVFAADDLLDNFFALHTMQEEFAEKDALFLECHIGDCEHMSSLEDDDIYDRALDVLDAYFPDEGLRGRLDRERSRLLRHVDVFPLFAPGDRERTPTVSDASRPNLMLAGDWVRTDDPEAVSFFMERAAVTGIEAANAILRAAGAPAAQREIARRAPPVTSSLLGFPTRAVDVLTRGLRRLLGVSYE
ncbi:MAG: FAD-dependent oxidoreductase [Labilithrix sp.]|nr:FAD-dependent oxidoreductase [Labilithrix sp.]MCW5817898.1 FAD-dependent oxidoreductase [Labilithrix sp.]